MTREVPPYHGLLGYDAV